MLPALEVVPGGVTLSVLPFCRYYLIGITHFAGVTGRYYLIGITHFAGVTDRYYLIGITCFAGITDRCYQQVLPALEVLPAGTTGRSVFLPKST